MVACFSCERDIVSIRKDSFTDAARRTWHLTCAKDRLTTFKATYRGGSCPGCGGPIARGERFTDAADRRWHNEKKGCTRAALGGLRA
jgi:hypothetical protein